MAQNEFELFSGLKVVLRNGKKGVVVETLNKMYVLLDDGKTYINAGLDYNQNKHVVNKNYDIIETYADYSDDKNIYTITKNDVLMWSEKGGS